MTNIAEALQVLYICVPIANFLLRTCRVRKAIELWKECLIIMENTTLGPGMYESLIKPVYEMIQVAIVEAYGFINDYESAIKYIGKLLEHSSENGEKVKECKLTVQLGKFYQRQRKYAEAEELYQKALALSKEICYKDGEATSYEKLGDLFQSRAQYDPAKEHFEKALAIRKELGDSKGEASVYENLAKMFITLSEYDKAKEFLEKTLTISKKIGDRTQEASVYQSLGEVCHIRGEYVMARDYLEKAIAIKNEYGLRRSEATCYGNIGAVFLSLGEYVKAKEYLERALAIKNEIGDKAGEGSIYGNLALLFKFYGDHSKSKKYFEKALAIEKEAGTKLNEASIYGNLGTLFRSLGEYAKAKECHENALAIRKEYGDRRGEASSYGNLGPVLQSVGEYVKAKEYVEKALEIRKEIGDRDGEATDYGNLGHVFESLGEHDEAKKYHRKALEIKREIGDRFGEAACLGLLGTSCQSCGEYQTAIEYFEESLEIRKQIGHREGEASCYGNLGVMYQRLGNYLKAEEYHEKAVEIRKEIGDKEGEAADYGNLGTLFLNHGKYDKANEYFTEGAAISESIGDVEKQVLFLSRLAWLKYLEGKVQEAFSYLLPSLQKCEDLRDSLGDNDRYKISFSDDHSFPYSVLSDIFCAAGKPNEALYALELGRARALADLMAIKYSVESQISANPQTWVGIERIMKNETNCSCLYIAYVDPKLLLWVIKPSGTIHFRQIKTANDKMAHSEVISKFGDLFTGSVRNVPNLPEKLCEDRSLNEIQPTRQPSHEDRIADRPTVEEYTEKQVGTPMLSLCYKWLIAPVTDLLEEPEIIIVPEVSLYQVPFPALLDESGRCLSDTFRIRIVPSLTTLKFIQDSPTDYHSQTGALIVGDPDVGRVDYKGTKKTISRLPCAGKEAAMIGELLSVEPLTGEQATKEAVLERLNEVSLIHFAAHGDSDTGEIALAPKRPLTKKFPRERDYLLKMSDISNVKLRAKLVVLSCCHSGRGETIRTEGVVGIARAFLGSGARSVLVALWAIEDSATEQFMSRFYEHLVRGESASESLHEAMKWMRGNGYSDVNQWAPFMLIGDDVTLNFGK